MCRTSILVAVLLAAGAEAQPRRQQGFNANGAQAPQPLDQIVLQVFDKDHDGSCSLTEVISSLTAFAGMAGGFGGDTGGGNQIETMINAAKRVAPTLFELLDADDSKGLTADELVWVAKVQKGLKSGALRNLTRDVFDLIDADADSVLTADEIATAADTEGAMLSQVVALIHEALPVRKSADELQQLLGKGVQASGLGLADGINYVDADGDGQIDRKEAGKAFKSFKDLYLQGAKALQEMGPMLAMFGNMEGMDGMGGMGGMGAMGAMGGRGGPGGGRGRGRGGAPF